MFTLFFLRWSFWWSGLKQFELNFFNFGVVWQFVINKIRDLKEQTLLKKITFIYRPQTNTNAPRILHRFNDSLFWTSWA
jgi:hypothetical protein